LRRIGSTSRLRRLSRSDVEMSAKLSPGPHKVGERMLVEFS
jgi:hypothetical protein